MIQHFQVSFGAMITWGAVFCILIGLFARSRKCKGDSQKQSDIRVYGAIWIAVGVVTLLIRLVPFHTLVNLVT